MWHFQEQPASVPVSILKASPALRIPAYGSDRTHTDWLRGVHLRRTEGADHELCARSQRGSVSWEEEEGSQPDDNQAWLDHWLYAQKQIPVASLLEISVCLSHASLSFPESLADTVSRVWNPTKSFPCYLSASTREKSLSSGTPVQCLPPCLPTVCGQLCSLLHTSSE